MKKLITSAAFSIALATTSASAASYKIDDSHSKVGFTIGHLGISSVDGRFASFSGSFEYDTAKVAASKVTAEIKVKSINTDNVKRDNHLRDTDFFNAAERPEITFVSKEVKAGKGKAFTILGDLTMNGVTKAVELQANYKGSAKDPWGNERAGFSASTTLNRKDYGLSWNKALETGGLLVGEDVEVQIEIEGIKQ